MTPRIQNRANQSTPVGESLYVLVGCLATVFLPPYLAARWIIRKIVERTRHES